MAVYSGQIEKAKNVLGSNTSINSWIDSKIKFVKTSSVNDTSFCEQETNNAEWRGFDIVNTTEEKYTTTITRSPVEDGTSIVEHISKPIETFTITGKVGQITVTFPKKLATLESNILSVLSVSNRYAPNLVGPANKIIQQGLSKINKLQTQAEGLLAEARSFYKVIQNFVKADFERRYVAFKTTLIQSQRDKKLFRLRIGGVEEDNLAITSVSISAEPRNTIDTVTFTITFEKINRTQIATSINKDQVRRVSIAIAKKEAEEAVKNTVGKTNKSLFQQGFDRVFK